MPAAAVTDMSDQRKLTAAQAVRRGLKGAFCERCGFEPANRSQAIAHAAACGSIVALREVVPCRRTRCDRAPVLSNADFDAALGEGRR
jgi:hypothetical protein